MTIELQPEVEAMVRRNVQGGAYTSAEAFVQEAVLRLGEQEAWLAHRNGDIRRAIDAGWTSAEEGRLRTEADVRSRMEQHKAAWRKQQP